MKRSHFNSAIVGCGRIAGIKDAPKDNGHIGTHAQAYYRNKKFKLVVAVNPHQEKIETFKKVWGITKGYTSLTKLLDHEVLDVISLCTPSEFHATQIKEILESKNKPSVVLAEKPVCMKREEFDHLVMLEKNSNCIVIVNHTRRFDPGHLRLKQFVEQNELGKFLQGRCEYYGGWFNNGSHMVDTLRMLFNEEPVIESVQLGQNGRIKDNCINIQLLIGNSYVDIVSFDESYYQVFEMELRFEEGRILVKDFGSDIIIEKVKTNDIGERVLVSHTESPLKGLDSPLYHAVSIIAEYLEQRKSLEGRGVLLNEVYGTMDILWKAVDSIRGN